MKTGTEMRKKTMLTDLYQLTMNAAYLDNNKDEMATFDLFVRKLPEDWGYLIANGIEDAIDYATNIKFNQNEIDYLKGQVIFNEEFLQSLKDFRFEGQIYAVREGTPVFANEPIVRVTAKRTQAQFLETTLLNTINFQTLIASKANRVVNAAKGGRVVDFGLRRAQGEDAAMVGARAAFIGGAVATSNVKAGMEYGIPISGTHAHSFVMSFPTELDAFRAYAKTFPKNGTLLIDTYDTVQGARNAAIVGKELEAKGGRLGAVRLDSGDLVDLSKKVRQVLDEAGLKYVKIMASNDLNEYKIEDLIAKGARIDGYGVGTEMITAKPVAAIPGVYKLTEDVDGAKIKLAPGKITLPGLKQVYRIVTAGGKYAEDLIARQGEEIEGMQLLEEVVSNGERVSPRRTLVEIRDYALGCVAALPDAAKRTRVPAGEYKVNISQGLQGLVTTLTEKYSVRT